MNYKQPCRFCNTLIDLNSYYCPYCGRERPCVDKKNEDTAESTFGPNNNTETKIKLEGNSYGTD